MQGSCWDSSVASWVAWWDFAWRGVKFYGFMDGHVFVCQLVPIRNFELYTLSKEVPVVFFNDMVGAYWKQFLKHTRDKYTEIKECHGFLSS